mmetsp:Transcript_17621/g.48382  ORF Transcript_17621/g.48382 Transcript_17621/m.48382 type:complete len:207 (+) Transcript_17621:1076-1696(+)
MFTRLCELALRGNEPCSSWFTTTLAATTTTLSPHTRAFPLMSHHATFPASTRNVARSSTSAASDCGVLPCSCHLGWPGAPSSRSPKGRRTLRSSSFRPCPRRSRTSSTFLSSSPSATHGRAASTSCCLRCPAPIRQRTCQTHRRRRRRGTRHRHLGEVQSASRQRTVPASHCLSTAVRSTEGWKCHAKDLGTPTSSSGVTCTSSLR